MKKILSFMLAIILCFSCCIISDAATVDVAQYRDWNFYGRSAPELVDLQLDCDTFSVYGESANPDEFLTCCVIDITHDGWYNMTFDFVTDQSVTTYAYAFPAGEYKVYFVGSDSTKKDLAVATFTKLD